MSNQGNGSGWQPLSKPNLTRPDLSVPVVNVGTPPASEAAGQPAQGNLNRRLNVDGSSSVTAFVRLARTHAFHAAGDAVVLVALAGTFFALDANGARSKILLYLVLTMAPFSLVGPLIGPALDRMRGGRRLMIILTMVVRALLMILMIRNIDTVWLFPIAFVQLVLGKTYSVAKAATVPTTVSNDDELVDKNSRLAVLSAVAGGVGAAPALGFQALFGSTVTLSYAALIYVCGLIAAIQMPRVFVDNPSVSEDDDHEIRSAGVRMASWATAMLRGIVGFVLFLLIFEFGRADQPDLSGLGTAVGAAVKAALGFDLIDDPGEPRWKVAIPFAFWSLGMFVGNILAPRLRQRFSEENMILGALIAVAAAASAAIWAGGISGAALLALVVGSTASAAKLAFDSLVQRDAPGANHGAAFGRFETRFQIAWVIGALLSVIIPFPLRVGFLVVALGSAAVAIFTLQQGARSGMRFGRGTRVPREPREPRGGGGGRRLLRTGQVPAVVPHRPSTPTEAPTTTPAGSAPPQATAGSARPAPNRGRSRQSRSESQPRRGTPGQAPRQAPVSHASDPYGEAFAQTPIEPPDWASAVFGDEPRAEAPADTSGGLPGWLSDGQDDNDLLFDDAFDERTIDDTVVTEPNPTPAMGYPLDPIDPNEPIDPNLY